METLELGCWECSRVTEISVDRQKQILAGLVRPAQKHVEECACGKFQFILTARYITEISLNDLCHSLS